MINFFFLFFLAVNVSHAGKGSIAFIRADIANIRKEPDADAQIVGRIQMNQKVRKHKESSGWTLIRYYGPKELGYSTIIPIVEGWISSSLLGKQSIKSSEMVDSASNASSPELRKKWVDRLVMAFPDEDAHWKLLQNTAKELGDTTSLKRARNHLNGKEDIYLAIGEGGMINLLGKIDSSGAFTSYIRDYGDYAPKGENLDEDEMKIDREKRLLHELHIVSACNWGKYTASFATLYNSPCPKDTIFTSQVHINGKRKRDEKRSVDIYRIRQELKNGTAVNPVLEDSAFANYDFRALETDSYRNDNMTNRRSRGYFRSINIKPYPAMNLFEAFAQVPAMSYREEIPCFQEIAGLFNAKGEKLYPPCEAHPYSGTHSENFREKDLCFFTFPKRNDGHVYTIYSYVASEGSGGNHCRDLLCFQEGKKMKHYTIRKDWAGD